MKRCRSWTAFGTLIVATAALSCGGSGGGGQGGGGIDLAQITFFRHGTNVILDAKSAPANQDSAYGEFDLSTTLVATPLGSDRRPGVDVRFASSSEHVEADVFARDPESVFTLVQSQAAVLSQVPQILDFELSFPAELPEVVALPPRALDDEGRDPLLESDFFEDATPGVFAAAPGGTGGVKAAYIYDHGPCSLEQDASTLLAAVNDGVWLQFVTKNIDTSFENGEVICNGSQHARVFRTRAFTFLRHNASRTDLRGGFFLDFWYNVHTSDVFMINTEIRAFSHSFWALDDGILTVQPHLDYAQVDGSLTPSDDVHKLKKAILNGLPPGVEAQALDMQTKDVLGPAGHAVACDPEVENPCANAIIPFGFALTCGADTLDTAGVVHFSNADKNALSDAANKKVRGVLHNWRCVPTDPKHPKRGNSCQYVVRARRINSFPDRVEFVWFDGKEVNNSTYALWVAAQAGIDSKTGLCNRKLPKNTTAVDQLCAVKPLETEHFTSFSRVEGVTNVSGDSNDDCTNVIATGGGGCSASGAGNGDACAWILALGALAAARRRTAT